MKRIVIISVSIVCVALIGLAVAAGPGVGWHRSPEEKVAHIKAKITDKLELDEAQKATLDRIAEEIVAGHQQVSGDREAFKARLIETLGKDSVSPEEIQALFESKRPVIEEMMQLASEHIAEFHSILTPEQRAAFIAEIESHQGRRCRFMR